jgi:hypothetical protein
MKLLLPRYAKREFTRIKVELALDGWVHLSHIDWIIIQPVSGRSARIFMEHDARGGVAIYCLLVGDCFLDLSLSYSHRKLDVCCKKMTQNISERWSSLLFVVGCHICSIELTTRSSPWKICIVSPALLKASNVTEMKQRPRGCHGHDANLNLFFPLHFLQWNELECSLWHQQEEEGKKCEPNRNLANFSW